MYKSGIDQKTVGKTPIITTAPTPKTIIKIRAVIPPTTDLSYWSISFRKIDPNLLLFNRLASFN